MTTQDVVDTLTRVTAQRDILQTNLRQKNATLVSLREDVARQIKARWAITEVAKQTQLRFKAKVETLVTSAIRSVFDRPFSFQLEFERKRNKLECRPVISEGDKDVTNTYDDPEYDVGGGLLDIISFAFRVVLLSLQKPPCRPVIILDEPLKNMGKMITLGGKVLREISHGLGIQLIIITHDDELIEIGDKVYQISHDGTKSLVKCIKGECADARRIEGEPTEVAKPVKRRIAR